MKKAIAELAELEGSIPTTKHSLSKKDNNSVENTINAMFLVPLNFYSHCKMLAQGCLMRSSSAELTESIPDLKSTWLVSREASLRIGRINSNLLLTAPWLCARRP